MNGSALRSLADDLSAAFADRVPAVSKEQRIVELAGGQWIGFDRNVRSWVLFRDPVTHSTCGVLEEGLTVASVQAKLATKRAEFGVCR